MMYEDKPMKNIIAYKVKRKLLDERYMKLKLMKGLGAFQGITFIEITLK